ncbi:hypothetical protein [Amycolatopsis sp. lyj-112]|uniref:hypothetical protein n=1 Tax=Amycolatopsis sp. lyj-112 TaxID=2789288 RepID=UPI00397950A2
MKGRFTRGAAVVAFAALTAMVPGVAVAGEAHAQDAIGPTAVAPACVYLDQWEEVDPNSKEWNSWGKMTNRCSGQTLSVRMIWSWARDGDCRVLRNGDWWKEGRIGPHPSISELRLC